MSVPAARWIVHLAFVLSLCACGDEADALAGTWAGANAKGPITLVVETDDTFVLTIDHEGLDGEPQREFGALRCTEGSVYLEVADYAPVEEFAPCRRAPLVLCISRVRREGGALLLERLHILGSSEGSPQDDDEVWLHAARLTREGR